MKFSALLFDLDGTLLDTAADLGAALNAVLSHYGKPILSAKEYTPEASHGARAMLVRGFGDSFADHDFEVLRSHFLQYYADHLALHSQFFDQVSQTLDYLNQHHIPWGIVTNKPTYLAEPLLTHFAEFAHCQVLVCGDTLSVAKPSPLPLLHALKALKQRSPIAPQDCLYVGDAQRDIEAGKNAGMKTAAAAYGYIGPEDNVASWEADHILNDFGELIALL